ncbi:MAG: type I glutamate--ammonia ligase [Anaerolineaceae bacterium]|nr:type I glutamate--ammonia ligase [Anaerolineaceae bacterium]
MFNDFSAADRYVQENNIRMIDLKFSDLWGRWRHVTLSAREFTPMLMQTGVGFDGSSVGLKSVKSGDMALAPDLSTGMLDPFCEVPTLSFICNTIEADSKLFFTRDPRVIARRCEDYLRSTGIADESRWGPEFEFYIFSKAYFENGVNTASYRFEALEASWNSATGGRGDYIFPHGGYHALPPKDQLFALRSRIVTLLEDMGVPVKYHHHEVGGPGQVEIETPMLGLLQAADASMVVKYVAHLVARQDGQTATFLPKPLYGEAGNGMHFHQQLFKNGLNVFYDPDGPSLLSQTALYYIGGLLIHAPAVLAFTNPSTNSYRRLVPGFEAPVNCYFSTGNRSAAIRVPKYATQPEAVRFEFRPPDASCNPYLAMPAMLMAGLDGICRKIDPTAAGFGPINEDVLAMSPERQATIKPLPTSLDGALCALKADHTFLLEGGVFEEDLIRDWINAKQAEFDQLCSRPHPFELQLYYDL